jgi:ankyrin repeat protein
VSYTVLTWRRDYVFDIHRAVDTRRPSLAPTLVGAGATDDYQDDVSLARSRAKADDDIFDQSKVELDADPNTSQFSSTLKHSVDKMDLDTISKLLQHGHDPLAQDKDGWCALHYAARTNNGQVCQILIDSDRIQGDREGIDTLNQTGATPLHFAASIGNLAAVAVLLDANADPHATDNFGRSPVFMAGEGNHLQVVQLLLKFGVEVPDDAPMRLKELQRAINWRNRKAKELRTKGLIPSNNNGFPNSSRFLSSR